MRLAELRDVDAIGVLLHAFNSEYGQPTPSPHALAERFCELLVGSELSVLLGGVGPDGIAVLRFRRSIWSKGLECYLAELYVVPERRAQGLGRALMEAALELAREQGADYMDLGTSEDDTAARGLYESLGFDNHGGSPGGPRSLYYEREL